MIMIYGLVLKELLTDSVTEFRAVQKCLLEVMERAYDIVLRYSSWKNPHLSNIHCFIPSKIPLIASTHATFYIAVFLLFFFPLK